MEQKELNKIYKMLDWLDRVRPGVYSVNIEQVYFMKKNWQIIADLLTKFEFVFNEEFTHLKKRINDTTRTTNLHRTKSPISSGIGVQQKKR